MKKREKQYIELKGRMNTLQNEDTDKAMALVNHNRTAYKIIIYSIIIGVIVGATFKLPVDFALVVSPVILTLIFKNLSKGTKRNPEIPRQTFERWNDPLNNLFFNLTNPNRALNMITRTSIILALISIAGFLLDIQKVSKPTLIAICICSFAVLTIRLTCHNVDEIFATLYGESLDEYYSSTRESKADEDDEIIIKSIDGLTKIKNNSDSEVGEAASLLIQTINRRHGIYDGESKQSVQRSMAKLLGPFESHTRDTLRLIEIQKDVVVIDEEATKAILSRFEVITSDIDNLVELALELEEDNFVLWSEDRSIDYRKEVELIAKRIKEDL